MDYTNIEVVFPDKSKKIFKCYFDDQIAEVENLKKLTKPCPLCGKFDTIKVGDNYFGGDFFIMCERCNIFLLDKDYEDIINRWNNRN